MRQTGKQMISVLMLMTLSLTGCGANNSKTMPYDSTVSFSTSLSGVSNEDTTEFMSKQLCVVSNDQNQGDDDDITGIASLLFDISNKEVIYADNVYERIYPASLTKLLTALVVLDEGNLTDTVTVSYNASHITESGAKLCGLKEGDQIVLKDLLTALLVYSGNDAGIAIAEHIAGSEEEFCNKMNEKAVSIGAVDTHFTNSHGLHSDDHYTTAYDLYLIFNELLKYEEAEEIIQLSSYTMNYEDAEGNAKQAIYTSTNRYLKGEISAPDGITVIGGKTGTTNAAGYCLEVQVEDESGNQYIVMVLKANNTDDLYRQINVLMDKIE